MVNSIAWAAKANVAYAPPITYVREVITFGAQAIGSVVQVIGSVSEPIG